MYLLNMLGKKLNIPAAAEALPGRASALPTAERHHVSGAALKGPYPAGSEVAIFGLGCFWGAERLFWQTPGVLVTMVGYCNGHTANATYDEVCSGMTGHAEVVRVVFDPAKVSYADLVKLFFEAHDPTQGMRQGNDMGTQYRSGLYVLSPAQRQTAEALKAEYGAALKAAGRGSITTEVVEAGPFYFAEAYHQQYLAKNPNGYCGLKGTGVSCPLPAFGG